MVEGVDYAWSRPDPTALYAAGKRFAIRYVSYDRTGKNLTRQEADRLQAAGLAIVTNWEWDPRDQLGGRQRGRVHATEADRQHRQCGGPPDRPIYFSTDFDATAAQLQVCYDYPRGCADVIGWDRVGVYGGIRTVTYMADRGVRWLWQTYAWSSGRWDSRAHIRQYRNGVRLAGGTVDLNRATVPDYGQWGQEDDMPTAREIADEIIERLTFTVPADSTAARLGLFAAGRRLRPANALAYGWGYAKVASWRIEEIATLLETVLSERAGEQVLAALREHHDAQAARLEQLEQALESAAVERAELMGLVRQVDEGRLAAEEVVRLIGERLSAPPVPRTRRRCHRHPGRDRRGRLTAPTGAGDPSFNV